MEAQRNIINWYQVVPLFYRCTAKKVTPIAEEKEVKKYTRTVKCPYCEEQIDRNTEDFTQHSNRYFHKECFNQRQEEIEERNRPRNDLIDYICELHNLQRPNGFILRQIKEFEEEYGYTLKGIEFSLRYFHDIEGNPVVERTGIGIVPHVYEDAKRYYSNIARIRSIASESEFDNTPQVIYTIPDRKRRKVKKIDIGGL